MGGIYINAVDIGSRAMIYLPSFIKIGFAFKVDKGDKQTHT
jgi:hypothetical protein